MTKHKSDHRAPLDAQPVALSEAEEAGILPETDRRHACALEGRIREGFAFSFASGLWTVVTPRGESGTGDSPDGALANVGAQIIPGPDGKRVLHRRDGTDIALDQ